MSKTDTKTYLVDLDWVVSKTYEIEAASREEAEKKLMDIVNRGDVCVWTDDFIATDEVKAECVGDAERGYW